jgi:hypothetical protein
MTQPAISGIAPFFIVADVPATLSFYRDKLGDGLRGFVVEDLDGYGLYSATSNRKK